MPKWASRGPQINPTPHVYLQISATPSAAHTVLTNGIVRIGLLRWFWSAL